MFFIGTDQLGEKWRVGITQTQKEGLYALVGKRLTCYHMWGSCVMLGRSTALLLSLVGD